jgi:hypothetical protein
MRLLKIAIQKQKEQKQREAKELRERNRLMRENVAILKEKLLYIYYYIERRINTRNI